MTTSRTAARLAVFGLLALAPACASGPGDPRLIGQLRLRPEFVSGEEPEAYKATIEHLHVVIRRTSGSRPVLVDTTLAYQAGSAPAWIIELAGASETLEVTAELDGGGRVLYHGSGETLVSAGVGTHANTHDVPVRWVGPAVSAIEVTPAAATLTAIGGTRQFEALARGPGGAPVTGFAFGWTSSNPAAATVDPVSGLATAVGRGVTVIAASAAGVTGSATLTVARVVAVRVSPAIATLGAFGAVQEFRAEALDDDGNVAPGVEFNWSSVAPDVATVEPATGLAVAAGNGRTSVHVTGAGLQATAELIVRQVVTAIDVSPGQASVDALGTTIAFGAVARDANGFAVEDASFAWTSSDAAVASVTGSSGVATAVAVGAVLVRATSGGVTGSAPLQVRQTVRTIVVTPDSATLTTGSTQQFSAAAFDPNGHPVPATVFAWTSDDAAVATVAGASGLVSATGVGRAKIIAAAAGVSGRGTVTVTTLHRSRAITVIPGHAVLGATGVDQQFTAVATDVDGKPIPGVVFNWSSGTPGVATISATTGLATATGYGVSTITAVADGLTGSATLEVRSSIASIQITPASAAIAGGGTIAFTAVARDAQGAVIPGVGFLWASSAPSVATVNRTTGHATGVADGTAVITAQAGGVSGQASLSVAAGGTGPVASVTITPDPGVIDALGGSLPLTAVARDANGHVLPGITFTWSTSDAAIATIDQAGVTTGAGVGTATVTAAAGGVLGTGTVQVRQVVASVTVQPATATLAIGGSVLLTAIARDANGQVIPGAAFLWTSDDPAVVQVDQAGLATALASGAVAVRARSAGVVGSATITVPAVGTIVILPGPELRIRIGETIQFTATVYDAAGNVIPGVPVAWASARPLIATIDPATGLATGLSTGGTGITASAAGATATVTLLVRPATVVPD